MFQMILQYLLGFCAWYGLSTIGEPPLTKSSVVGDHISFSKTSSTPKSHDKPSKEQMPIWLIFLFFALVATRYILSYLISYVFEVISTVAMVSSEDISILGAALARKRSASHPRKIDPETKKKLRKAPTFQPRFLSSEKRTFTRRLTMPIQSLGQRFFGLACLRGLSPFLIMSVSQWYIGAFSDFFLSGQPKELESGYGATSVFLAVFFGGGSALWTHYAIIEPGNRNIYDHFPRGSDILVELYPITCLWALCEQVTRSLPLALSRSSSFKLRKYAWTPLLWSSLDASSQRFLLFKFSIVYLLYLVLVATLLIPATMTLRRIHASMLPDADEAIVPFFRGNPVPRDDEESSTYSPGLSISNAWATLTWGAYLRVLRIFVQYFVINQLLHLLCWKANWVLHDFFQADEYTSPFPSGHTWLNLQLLG